MIAQFCPHCGGKLPIMVSDEDIRAEVEAHAEATRPPDNLTWSRPYLDHQMRYIYDWQKRVKQDG